MKHVLTLLLLFISFQTFGQHKYWILLKDKPLKTKPALSPLALERRAIQDIELDEKDFPLSQDYLCQLSENEVIPLQRSRWINAVSARLSPAQIDRVNNLPFVIGIRPVAQVQAASNASCSPEDDYGTYLAQLSQIGLDDLHARGFRGEGLRIAVLDNGFAGVDTIPAFQHVWERNGFIYDEDFVEPGTSLFGRCRGSCKHGTRVLSVMAAKWPGKLMGAAPGADYLLFRTENDVSETHQEEDNWMAAAEAADSLGADVIISALTYKDFDPGEGDYTDAELDGKTALVTIAAEIAASKGMIVVNSVGNYGQDGIGPPADGPNVLAIGSVSQEGALSSFSGFGPTFDGRIKPDLIARGDQIYLLHSDGEVNAGSGTSYSAPLVAGLAACLWQVDGKQHSAAEMTTLLRQSGNLYFNPDNAMGFGLPQASVAYETLTGERLTCLPAAGTWQEEIGSIYPNPGKDKLQIALKGLKDGQELEVLVTDFLGKVVHEEPYTFQASYQLIQIDHSLNPGHYMLRIQAAGGGLLFAGKFVVIP